MECGRVQHYTNKQGLEGIKENGGIKARDNNLVYVEPARKKPMSVRDAETNTKSRKAKVGTMLRQMHLNNYLHGNLTLGITSTS